MQYSLRKNHMRPIIAVSVVLCAAWSRAHSQQANPAKALPAPERSISFSLRATPGYSFPLYRNGFTVKHKMGPTEMDANNLIIADVNTGSETSYSHTVEGYKNTVLTTATLGDRNTLITAGYASNGTTATYFIAHSDMDGHALRTISTNGYLASAVCAGSNDTIWALGRIPHQDNNKPYFSLRHYTWGGQALEGAIKTSSDDQHFGVASVDPRQIFLECVKDNVFVYDGVSHRLYRYDSGTHLEHSWKLRGPSDLADGEVTGFAVADSQKIFVSMRERQHTKQARRGLYQLVRVDQKTSELRPVLGTGSVSRKLPFWLLMGSDQGRLVYVDAPESEQTQLLKWVKPAAGSDAAAIQ